MNIASIFHGCHMGLTGLGALAVEGYRPTTQKYPNLKAALVAFDIASLAGSFEASFYESLILSRKLTEFYPRLRNSTLYFFDK